MFYSYLDVTLKTSKLIMQNEKKMLNIDPVSETKLKSTSQGEQNHEIGLKCEFHLSSLTYSIEAI